MPLVADVWKQIVIATQPDTHVGRNGSVLSVSSLKQLGHELRLPVHIIPKTKFGFKNWQVPAPFNIPKDGESHPLDYFLITASFGRILPHTMLKPFDPTRRLNVHPSLLPAYRGPAPIQHAIMNGDKKTGVCVIEMLKSSQGIDAGDIWASESMDIPEDANFSQMRDALAVAGGRLLVSVLKDAMQNKAVATPQASADNAPPAPLISSKDAFADFHNMTAEEIYWRFRAISHQKEIFTLTPDDKILKLRQIVVPNAGQLADTQLSSTPGHAVYSKSNKMILIRCKDQTVLGVTTVRPEGKADREAFEFWTGLRSVKNGSAEAVFGKVPSS
ncbi:Methionyl-tRNA formyltransferase [Psilocybe cubensis]|uniref:Methionyl-tRNA formyltransferase n=2 Tax=Psilocybe cubensis TaxID=181762 RepID=A0ACB8GSD6_PSICU|nr:Methionyl-tRNA formyltransferase [Psilocybe cubensis]KAH9478337.1 Methionyl-tRNA formyltransferase [Psilocybe cubensis]